MGMGGFASYITDFADAGVIVPVCAVVALTLLLFRQHRIAGAWIAATFAVWAVMALLKFGGYACESLDCALPPPSLNLISPSGHVAASAAAYGGLLGLLFGSAGRSVRQSCLAAGVVSLVIGTTRIALGDHSIAEVIVGAAVGITGAAVFTAWAHGWLSNQRRAMLLGVVALSMLLFHGTHLTWERQIRAVSAGALQILDEAR